MFNTEKDRIHIIKAICKAKGNLKVDEGQGYVQATVDQVNRIAFGVRLGLYRIVGYTERSQGTNTYEVSLAIRKI